MKQASEARRSKLYRRIAREARWCLEHPADAAVMNAGAPIATESDLVDVTRARCALKRIPGYGEGDVLANACRSEWHLLSVRRGLVFGRLRDLRTNPNETTRGTRRRRRKL